MLSHTFVTAQKLHRVVSSVCPWLHEIVLTSINISKRHWMRQGEADKTESNLNELIEWTNDVCSIQNTKNLCCPCLEEGKGGRHRDKKRERGNYKVRTRRRNGEEIWLVWQICTYVSGGFWLKGNSEIPFRHSVNSVGVSLYLTLFPLLPPAL